VQELIVRPSVRKAAWILATLAAIAGVWISYRLTEKHLQVADPNNKSILDEACEATETSSCDEVIKTEWGRFPPGLKDASGKPAGIPVAELGLQYFICVLTWLVLIGAVSPSRWWAHLILLAATSIGLLFAVVLAVNMYGSLDYWCPLCAAIHVLSLLLVVFVVLMWPERTGVSEDVQVVTAGAGAATESGADAGALFYPASTEPVVLPVERNVWPHWWMIGTTVVVMVLAVEWTSEKFRSKQHELQTRVAKYQATRYEEMFKPYQHPRHTLLQYTLTNAVQLKTEGEPVRGPADAVHTVVVFSDFQCPVCKKFEEVLEGVQKKLAERGRPNAVKVIFKHWPICKDCNPAVKNNLHPVACQAARAAEAARILGGDEKFYQMHDLLFDTQETWTKTKEFEPLAKRLGFDPEAFTKAMESEEASARIKANIEEGNNIGNELLKTANLTDSQKKYLEEEHKRLVVDSTPAVFVDGRRMPSWGQEYPFLYILGLPQPYGASPGDTDNTGGNAP